MAGWTAYENRINFHFKFHETKISSMKHSKIIPDWKFIIQHKSLKFSSISPPISSINLKFYQFSSSIYPYQSHLSSQSKCLTINILLLHKKTKLVQLKNVSREDENGMRQIHIQTLSIWRYRPKLSEWLTYNVQKEKRESFLLSIEENKKMKSKWKSGGMSNCCSNVSLLSSSSNSIGKKKQEWERGK